MYINIYIYVIYIYIHYIHIYFHCYLLVLCSHYLKYGIYICQITPRATEYKVCFFCLE